MPKDAPLVVYRGERDWQIVVGSGFAQVDIASTKGEAIRLAGEYAKDQERPGVVVYNAGGSRDSFRPNHGWWFRKYQRS